MKQISKTVRISSRLADLFREVKELQPSEAAVTSNVPYVVGLEHGTSAQAPQGIVRAYRKEYAAMAQDSMSDAFELVPGSIQHKLNAGVSDAALRIMAAIAERTPVDTGRAKGSWIATLPGGKRIESGPTISADQQKAIRKGRNRKTSK